MNARLDLTPEGCFVAVPRTIGATPEESDVIRRGDRLPDGRFEALRSNLRSACNQLMCAEPLGHA